MNRLLHALAKSLGLALFVAVGYSLTAAALSSHPVDAHTADTSFYIASGKWQKDPNLIIGDQDSDLDGTASVRSQTVASANAVKSDINGISGSTFDISSVFMDLGVTWAGSNCATSGNSVASGRIAAVVYNWPGTGTPAKAGWCTGSSSGNIFSSTIRFDYQDWDPGGAVPSDKLDFQGVLIHEVIHATGFGLEWRPDHWAGTTYCPTNQVLRHTMCSGYQHGQVWKRSMESHDSHTIASAY